MKKAFFISDVHLGLEDKERERAKERRLLSFFRRVEEEGDQLYILGDLFDYWFEYKYVIPRGYHHVLSALGRLVEHGVEVRYLAGNHDFWLKDFFPSDLGIPVYKDPVGITIGGKRFYLHHGDGLALRDAGYRLLKKVLRNRLSIFFFTLIHPDITAPIAKASSKGSRQYTDRKDFGETDGMILCATDKIREGYDFVVMGHRHVPLYQAIGRGVYINLGDWISYSSYAEFDGSTIALKSWKED